MRRFSPSRREKTRGRSHIEQRELDSFAFSYEPSPIIAIPATSMKFGTHVKKYIEYKKPKGDKLYCKYFGCHLGKGRPKISFSLITGKR